MPWTEGILLLTIIVMVFSSSLSTAYGVVTEDTISVGKLLVGDQAQFHPAQTKLQQLGTSVHCGNDSMTLRVPGPRMPHFMVDRGEGSPVPLSEMPASCGFSLKRVRRDVSLVAPYRGCHVRQQSGSYVLPLIIMGAPARMSCPVSSRLPAVSCLSSVMVVTLDIGADELQVKVDDLWQPLLLTYSKCSFILETNEGSLVITAPYTGSCWEMKDTERHLPLLYGNREVTLSCPVTPTAAPPIPTTTPFQDTGVTQDMFYPFPWWYPYPKGYFPNLPTTTTTTPPPPQDPMSQQMYPMYPMKGFNPYYFYYKGFPTVPPPTTTTAPPPPQDPMSQQLFYPMRGFDPNYFYNFAPPQRRDWFPGFSRYMYGFQNPVQMTTPATTTAAAQDVQYGRYPPMFYGQQPIKQFVPPNVQYPFMPRYPQTPVFAPRSLKPDTSPVVSTSISRSRRHLPKAR